MATSLNPGPFDGQTPNPNRNRINRITFSIGGVKTAAHVVDPTGSLERYDRARNDSVDPAEVQAPIRKTFITEQTEEE